MKTLKDICIYGIFIPIIVMVLAEIAITISCKYYWGEHVLGFKLSIWQLTLSICLSVIYYLFCIVYKLVNRKANKRVITLLEGCLKVGVTPICPIAPIGKDSYKHGYGMGYAKAQKKCKQ